MDKMTFMFVEGHALQSILYDDPDFLKKYPFEVISREGPEFGITLESVGNTDISYFKKIESYHRKRAGKILRQNKNIANNVCVDAKMAKSYDKSLDFIDMMKKVIDYKNLESRLAEKN